MEMAGESRRWSRLTPDPVLWIPPRLLEGFRERAQEADEAPESMWVRAVMMPPPTRRLAPLKLLDQRGFIMMPPGLTSQEERLYAARAEASVLAVERHRTREESLLTEIPGELTLPLRAVAALLPEDLDAFEVVTDVLPLSSADRRAIRLSRPPSFTTGLKGLREEYTAVGLARLRGAYLRRWATDDFLGLCHALEAVRRSPEVIARGGWASLREAARTAQGDWALERFWATAYQPFVRLADHPHRLGREGPAFPAPPPLPSALEAIPTTTRPRSLSF